MTPTKSETGASLIAWQDIPTANVIVGAAVDVSTKFAAALDIRLGRRSGTAFTASPRVRIEGSVQAAGGLWTPLVEYDMAYGASIANTTLSGAVAAAAATLAVAAATNIAARDVLFLGHTSDVSKYEIVRLKSLSGTTLTPEEAVVNAHDSGAPVTDQAEMYLCYLDLTGLKRLRAVVDNASSGQTVAAQIIACWLDSLG